MFMYLCHFKILYDPFLPLDSMQDHQTWYGGIDDLICGCHAPHTLCIYIQVTATYFCATKTFHSLVLAALINYVSHYVAVIYVSCIFGHQRKIFQSCSYRTTKLGVVVQHRNQMCLRQFQINENLTYFSSICIHTSSGNSWSLKLTVIFYFIKQLKKQWLRTNQCLQFCLTNVRVLHVRLVPT